MWRGRAGQVKPWVTWADVLTALRVPLAVAFPFVHHAGAQLRELAGRGGARSRRGQAVHGGGVSHRGAVRAAAPGRDRRRPGARHRGGARVPRRLDRAALGVYAIWDYGRAATRGGRSVTPDAAGAREEGERS